MSWLADVGILLLVNRKMENHRSTGTGRQTRQAEKTSSVSNKLVGCKQHKTYYNSTIWRGFDLSLGFLKGSILARCRSGEQIADCRQVRESEPPTKIERERGH